MPINAHPEYIAAEREYDLAEDLEDKLKALEKMISLAPKHKGAENLRAQLKLRYKKLKEKISSEKRSRKSSARTGIKKEDMQAVIIGKTKIGKSSLISLLTNAKPETSDYGFATKSPVVGMMNYNGVPVQLIEIPAVESEYYNKGIVNNADTILILITDIEQLKQIEKKIEKSIGNRIIIFNKIDTLSENEKRKIRATLKSKYRNYDFVLISSKTNEGIKEMKEKLFHSFGKIRIYTKQPGEHEKSKRPIILPPESMVKDVAEKILKGFTNKIKETKIWGPSSKYPGQIVGLNHKMKDMDTIEFKTK